MQVGNPGRTDEGSLAGPSLQAVRALNAAFAQDAASRARLAAALSAYARGDFEEPVPDLPGHWGELAGLAGALRANLASVDRALEVLAQAAAEGNLTARAEAGTVQGRWAAMTSALNRILESLQAPVNEATVVLEALAARNLRPRVRGTFRGDHGRITAAVNAAADALQGALAPVAAAAEQVGTAAQEIASSSQSVASNSAEQAGALEDSTRSLEMTSNMVRVNADYAQLRNLVQATASSSEESSSAAAEMSAHARELSAMLETFQCDATTPAGRPALPQAHRDDGEMHEAAAARVLHPSARPALPGPAPAVRRAPAVRPVALARPQARRRF